MSAPKNTISGIQALRAFAALAVVCEHLKVVNHGAFGVDVFFVISGFVIAHVGAREAAGIFVAKRLFRIVPLYWLGTILTFGVALVAPSVFNATTADVSGLIHSLLFLAFQNHAGLVRPILFLGWSLNYEMFFYAVFAVSLLLFPRRPEVPTTIVIGGMIVLGRIHPQLPFVFGFWTYPITAEFLFGLWLHRSWQAGWSVRIARFWLCAMALIVSERLLFDDRDSLHDWRAITLGIPATALLVLVLLLEGMVAWPPLLLLIGDASYSLYLFHPYVVEGGERVLGHISHNPLIQYIGAPFILGAAILVAVGSYRLIERPTNRWLVRTFLKRDRPVAVAYAGGP